MSANIQFIETGNLLSPDKGDMSGFLASPCIVRCVGRKVGRLEGGGGAPGTYRRSVGRCCLWPYLERQYSSAGSAAVGSVLLAELFSGSGIYRRLRFSSDADIVRLTNARIIII